MKKLVFLLLSIMIIPSVFAGGGGGGGVFYGYQVSNYDFLLENYEIPNNTLGLSYFGGYGYGVSRDGIISGGFGMAIVDTELDSGITGGFGGVINGIQILDWPIHLSLVSYTGFGGIYTGSHSSTPNSGFFAVSEEIDLEIGLPLFGWFMPTVFIGYQVAGNIIPGDLFSSFFSYSPVVGIRIGWGSF